MRQHLSHLPHSEVIAVDRTASELEVARAAFGDRANIRFEEADIFTADLGQFDTVILGAAAQYFPDLVLLLERLLQLVRNGGEIHILGTPFYRPAAKMKAMKRSRAYYEKHGFPDLAEHYFHHDAAVLERFRARRLYDPGSLNNRIRRKLWRVPEPPFPWYVIRKA